MDNMMFKVEYVCSWAGYEYTIAYTCSRKDAELIAEKSNNPKGHKERGGAHKSHCCFYFVSEISE